MPQELPDELLLHILQYVSPHDVWSAIQPASRRLAACAEDHMKKHVLPHLVVGLQFSLGSGSHHRWYDVRGQITFTFQHVNKHNPDYALFGAPIVHPQRCFDRAMQHYRQLADVGVGERQEWRVQEGYVGEVRVVRLPKAVVADGEGVFLDWREVCDAYYGSFRGSEHLGDVAWSSRAN